MSIVVIDFFLGSFRLTCAPRQVNKIDRFLYCALKIAIKACVYIIFYFNYWGKSNMQHSKWENNDRAEYQITNICCSRRSN